MFIFLLTWVALNVLGHCNCGFRYGVLYFLNQLIYIYIFQYLYYSFYGIEELSVSINSIRKNIRVFVCMVR